MQLSVLDLWQATGPAGRVVVVVLLGLSLASIAVGVERLVVLRRATRGSALFLAAWRESHERPWGGAVDVAGGPGDGSPAAILLRALGEVLDSGMPREVAERAFDRTTRRILLSIGESLRRGLGLLATVGSTAPFVGLFGTVVGIVNAFQQMAQSGQGGLATVSGGIAEALLTTALGILTAIPALWLYNAITGRIATLLTNLECAAEDLAVQQLDAEFATTRGRAAPSGGLRSARRPGALRAGRE